VTETGFDFTTGLIIWNLRLIIRTIERNWTAISSLSPDLFRNYGQSRQAGQHRFSNDLPPSRLSDWYATLCCIARTSVELINRYVSFPAGLTSEKVVELTVWRCIRYTLCGLVSSVGQGNKSSYPSELEHWHSRKNANSLRPWHLTFWPQIQVPIRIQDRNPGSGSWARSPPKSNQSVLGPRPTPPKISSKSVRNFLRYAAKFQFTPYLLTVLPPGE